MEAGLNFFAATVLFAAAAGILAFILFALNEPLVNDTCYNATSSAEGDCGALTESEENDKVAVHALSFTWLGYPLIAALSFPWVRDFMTWLFNKFNMRPDESLIKDVGYALLDVVSKSGLAIYVAFRTTWLPSP